MCGIYGILEPETQVIPGDLVDRMRDSIRHRGPDQTGRYREPGLVMGTNRLAIVDLVNGDQPIFNEDRSLVIVYNGELYNHLDLRTVLEAKGHVFRTRTDTETILHAFEEYGPECLHRFNGMFSFAIWNTRSRSLFLARDRLGIKPLYIAETPRGLAFASEAKALLPLLPDGPRPDWTAIYRFFSYGYVPAPESPFAGIRKFPAAHYGWVKGARLSTRRYWAPEYGLGEEIDFEQARDTLRALLDRAVEAELMSDVPVGVFLSGGLDSSAVAAFARKHTNSAIHSFALRFNETTHDESADARLVAEHLGLQHHEFTFAQADLRRALDRVAETLDEPFGDSTVLPLLALSEFTREHVRVVLTGWGGDEIFAGYPTYKAHRLGRLYRRLPDPLTRRLIPAVVNRLPVSDEYMSFEFKAKRFINGTDLPPEYQHFVWMGYFDDRAKDRLFQRHILEQLDGDTLDPVRSAVAALPEKNLVDRIMHLDALFFLEGNGLFQADRMTMAASLEARVPLLNHDLLTFINHLPFKVKARRGKMKELLRSALAPVLPPRILKKPKKGFGPPSSTWTRGILSATIDDLFSRESVEERGIFNFNEIRRLITEHQSRKADHGRELWALLSFQLWYDKWIMCQGAVSSRATHERHQPATTSHRDLPCGVTVGT
jgi:asparagine synthase (glutamine-hydrolysing)